MVLKAKFKGITRETTDLLHKANRLTEDIQGKVERLNSVVDGVKGIGDSVQNLNGSVDRVTNSITHNISQNEDKISQVVQWSNVAMEIAATNGKIDTTVEEVQTTETHL